MAFAITNLAIDVAIIEFSVIVSRADTLVIRWHKPCPGWHIDAAPNGFAFFFAGFCAQYIAMIGSTCPAGAIFFGTIIRNGLAKAIRDLFTAAGIGNAIALVANQRTVNDVITSRYRIAFGFTQETLMRHERILAIDDGLTIAANGIPERVMVLTDIRCRMFGIACAHTIEYMFVIGFDAFAALVQRLANRMIRLQIPGTKRIDCARIFKNAIGIAAIAIDAQIPCRALEFLIKPIDAFENRPGIAAIRLALVTGLNFIDT